MKKSLLQFSAFALTFLFSSCASIVSKSNWPVSIDSNPTGSTLVITNREGKEVYKGTSPATVILKSGAGFFKKESYTLHFELAGYGAKDIPLECTVNGWYWGNILLGGVVGMLIIDPATGAMYKLSTETVNETLIKSTAGIQKNPKLQILSLNELPKSEINNLVKLN